MLERADGDIEVYRYGLPGTPLSLRRVGGNSAFLVLALARPVLLPPSTSFCGFGLLLAAAGPL